MTTTIEINREQLLQLLIQDKTKVRFSIKEAFHQQLMFVQEAAKEYYSSQAALPVLLLRPFLLSLIAEDEALRDYFGQKMNHLIQAVYDMAFLRQLMVWLVTPGRVLSKQEQLSLIQTSEIATFKQKLAEQKNWQALLNVMEKE